MLGSADDSFARFCFGGDCQRGERCVVAGKRLPGRRINRESLLAEHRFKLGPHFLRTRHRLDALVARVSGKALAHLVEILLVVCCKLELAADFKALPESGAEERPEKPV